MSGPALQYEPEPFGQRGVRPLVRPIIVGLCAIAVATSAAMWYRSQRSWDRVYRVADDHSTEYASVLGRLMITTWPLSRPAEQTESWTYDSQEFTTIRDGWEPSIWKTLGLQWGTEVGFGGGRRFEYWRLRLAWRTACLVSILPIAVDAVLRRRRSPIATRADAESATV